MRTAAAELESEADEAMPDGFARLEALARKIEDARSRGLVKVFGRVSTVDPAGLRVAGLSRLAKLGEFVRLGEGDRTCLAEVTSIEPSGILVKPLSRAVAAGLDAPVEHVGDLPIWPDESWFGRTITALAEPADQGGPLKRGSRSVSLHAEPPPATERGAVDQPLTTGVRAVDIFTPLCFGQRIGVFAGSGVGKSTLLGMMARAKGFDAVVVALVGERGREVNEFIGEILGSALAKSIVVAATGDEAPGMRKLAPRLATRLAEHFRDEGKRVLLIVDSVTRFAMAAREVALAAGEPPVSRGYPPSVFSDLPHLLERAGPGVKGRGSITGVYAVLVDGDDHNEPIADAIRGILDGHVVLDRDIANGGRFPAVDVLASLSRLSGKSWTPEQAKLAGDARRLIHAFESTKDLRLLGNHQPGQDAELDLALEAVPKLYRFLSQTAQAKPDENPFPALAETISASRPAQAASSRRPTS